MALANREPADEKSQFSDENSPRSEFDGDNSTTASFRRRS